MDAILETSPHFHNTPELSMCWGGGEPQFSRHTLRVGLAERYPFPKIVMPSVQGQIVFLENFKCSTHSCILKVLPQWVNNKHPCSVK